MTKGAQRRLEEELERLKQTLNVNYDLKVIWVPKKEGKLSGEVRGSIIYLYEEEKGRAMETLKHEFIDYHITKEIVDPLIGYINVQKSLIDGLIYERKEDLVDRIAKLL